MDINKRLADMPAGSKYGSSMGRSCYCENLQAMVYLQAVELVDGDYDRGGAYWGGSDLLWCAMDEQGDVLLFVRGKHRAKATEAIKADYPDLTVMDDDRPHGFIVELTGDGMSACRMDGREIKGGKLFEALERCTARGDCEDACRNVLSLFRPEFRVVKQIGGEYQNVVADHDDKRRACLTVYGDRDSRSDFDDESMCEVYLIWQAAADAVDQRV